MPLPISALAAALAAILAAGAAAADECEIDSEAIQAQAAKVGIEMGEHTKVQDRGGDPHFSDLAEALAMQGRVSALLLIGRDGAVADQVVLCSEPFGYFEPAVLTWAKNFRFEALAGDSGPRFRGYLVTVNFRFKSR